MRIIVSHIAYSARGNERGYWLRIEQPRCAIRQYAKGGFVNQLDTDLMALMDGLAPRARLMGVDLGTKTIGLALSDVEHRIATPLETIKRVKFTPDAARVAALAEQHGVGGLVVGWPLNMDGSEGPRAQSTQSFVRNLRPILPLPVLFWDERLSTIAVTRTLLDADASRARRAELVDKMAAAYILQGALDRYERIIADRYEAQEDGPEKDLDINKPPTGGGLDF
jgi:putative Holliday junction resolvase